MKSGAWNRVAWGLAVAFAWLWTWRHLSLEWRSNEQYQFGFGVPFLCAWMAWKRLAGPLPPARAGWGCACLLACAATAFVLGELLRWHDPLWRMTGALLALSATLLTAAAFYRLGGRTLLRRELFPLAFAWLAVPWPVPVELFVTQHLLHFITSVTISLLNLGGIAALQRGNVIELSHGLLGLDDACSGIRSLQAVLMASLFLGEFFQLHPFRRTGLWLGGWVASLLANGLRVLTLALILHSSGAAAEAHRHDFVGGAATVLTFAAILFLAVKMSRGLEPESALRPSFPLLSGLDGSFAFAGVVAIPLLIWAWFSQWKIPMLEQGTRWQIETARLPSGWSAEVIEPTAALRSALRFHEWQACRVRSVEGRTAQIIHLAWKRGTNMPGMAFSHTPAMCMPWSGWTQTGVPAAVTFDLPGGPLPCVAYRFRQGDATQVVLQNLSGNGGDAAFDPQENSARMHRLSTLWRAPLRQVNEELLVYLPGNGDADLPASDVREFLNAVLVQSPR